MAQTLTWLSQEFQEIKAGRNRSCTERPRLEFALISSKRFGADLRLSRGLNLRSQSDEDAAQMNRAESIFHSSHSPNAGGCPQPVLTLL